MTSRRIDNFNGSQEQYIAFLEDKIVNLRSRCNELEVSCAQALSHLPEPARSIAPVPNTLSLTSPPTSVLSGAASSRATSPNELAKALANRSALQQFTSQFPEAPEVHSQSHDLEILHWSPSPKQQKPRDPAWKQHANELVRATPISKDWWEVIQEQGIYDVMCNGVAVAHVLGDERLPLIAIGPTMSLHHQPHFPIVDRITSYGRITAQRHLTASVASRLANFQTFLFLCCCVVAQATATPQIPEERILEITKIGLGDMSDDYCRRLLRVAVYVNTLIDILNAHGWDSRAAELILICR